MKINKSKPLFLILPAAVLLIIIVSTLIFKFAFPKSGPLTVTDNKGNKIISLEKLSFYSSEKKYGQYLDIVIPEAINIIAGTTHCSEEKAKENLVSGGYTVHTSFDENAFSACAEAYENSSLDNSEFSSVVTSTNGEILCVYSVSNYNDNLALQKTKPYSAFKPLSVYAPALEKGVLNWSSLYMDSAVKQVPSSNGGYEDWPTNTSPYTQRNVTVCEGIKLSLNTVAVRSLIDLGANNSIDFLTENFDINCDHESRVMELLGEDEILANLAMGYLESGVSPLDMAGYYQIFANGGKYTRPYAVLSITDSNGKTVYEHSENSKQVISEETAFIMNKLLQNTMTDGGTGEKANIPNIESGGKTGTGSDFEGNWFVGFTPQYICSIWHGKNDKNLCTTLFPDIIKGLDIDKGRTFPNCPTVQQLPYCTQSGGLLTPDCEEMEVGYYSPYYLPNKCGLHF